MASLAPLANPVAVLLPENVRSAVEGGCRSSNRALADTPRISSAGVSFATTSVGPNFRWVACAWSGPATASCATSSTALRVEARDERRCEGPGGFIVLRGRRGRGVSCQRARRNTRHTGSTDRMIRHVLWRERTPRQAPKRTPRARVFVSIAASRALSTMGRESFVVAIAGARRGACGGQASRPIFFEVIARVARHDRERWFHAWRASRGSGNARVSLGGARRVSANVARRFRFPSTRASVRAPRVSSCYNGAAVTHISRDQFSRRRLRPDCAALGPAKLSRPLSPGKAREFWRQSVTPDFARVLISKRRVTYEKSRFPVKSTRDHWRNADWRAK